jgi:hypothetical protein
MLANPVANVMDGLAPVTSQVSYVLEVRGLVTGSAGGLYSGQFTVAPAPVPAPVPVPAALWLMGSALGLVGAASRSRPQVKQS